MKNTKACSPVTDYISPLLVA